jgi:hypothetical protein
MLTNHPKLVALMAAGLVAGVACVEPIDDPDDESPDPTARYGADECTVVNPGPGVPDGLVGICHFNRDDDDSARFDSGYTEVYAYLRVTPDICRTRHASHEFDFRSDDPLCRILPRSVHLDDVVSDTVLAH